jgi:hypothetical protein
VTDDYMPDPERSVAYKLLDPGFTKVFAFGTQFGQIGYIIADSWEDAYEELLDHAYEVDGPCDHGNDPELAALIANLSDNRAVEAANEAVWTWIDDHCDCEQSSNGRVWMVDSWWHRETAIHPYALVKALIAHPPTREKWPTLLDALLEWYEPGEDEH